MLSSPKFRRYLGRMVGLVFCSTGVVNAATMIPSPADDILLSSNGGVANINGSTSDGAANYSGLPAANLNDGDRDGRYGNGGGVDGMGSIAHSSSAGVNEMGVTIPTSTFIGSVNVFNRTDCCGSRIDGSGNIPFTLEIFNGATSVFSNTYKFVPTASLTAGNASGMSIETNVVGTSVRVTQNNSAEFMNLAEIEAFVPEPTSLSLLGLGAIGVMTRRRRR